MSIRPTGSSEETSSAAFQSMIEEINDISRRHGADTSPEPAEPAQPVAEQAKSTLPAQEEVAAAPPLEKGFKHCCNLF
jgi:hypothetical protein